MLKLLGNIDNIVGSDFSTRAWLYSGVSKLWCMGQIWPVTYLVNKVLLAHSHVHSSIYCVWLLLCCSCRGWQSQQRLWPVKPKIFTIWLLTEEVCQSLVLPVLRYGLSYTWVMLYFTNVEDVEQQIPITAIAVFLFCNGNALKKSNPPLIFY